MCQPGVALTHSQLATSVALPAGVAANTIARHISVLRRKLADDHAHPRYIETVTGVGYRFVARG
jgi:DNA-binding response OmpR family regulator